MLVRVGVPAALGLIGTFIVVDGALEFVVAVGVGVAAYFVRRGINERLKDDKVVVQNSW
jgi:hypothetical protein